MRIHRMKTPNEAIQAGAYAVLDHWRQASTGRCEPRRSATKGKTTMTSEVRCGFLTYHPPMPNFPTIVRYKGQWMPEALITHGDHKRLTDSELAAEFHQADAECQIAWIDGEHTDAMQARFDTVERFAMAPHFDDQFSTEKVEP